VHVDGDVVNGTAAYQPVVWYVYSVAAGAFVGF
jgi:hypothetical protein